MHERTGHQDHPITCARFSLSTFTTSVHFGVHIGDNFGLLSLGHTLHLIEGAPHLASDMNIGKGQYSESRSHQHNALLEHPTMQIEYW